MMFRTNSILIIENILKIQNPVHQLVYENHDDYTGRFRKN
jgi:hypothetical protein